MNRKIDLKWSGMLTVKNIEEIANLIFLLLNGRNYTFVTVNELFRFKPEVRTGQKLYQESGKKTEAVSVQYDGAERNSAGFNVNDTYGLWGCRTNLLEDIFDPEFKNPYIEFSDNQIMITHRASPGQILYWIAAVEKENFYPLESADKRPVRELTIEEFLGEIRKVGIRPLEAEQIKLAFDCWFTRIHCTFSEPHGIMLYSSEAGVRSFLINGFENKKELAPLNRVVITDLKRS